MKKILLALFFIFLVLFVFRINSFAAGCTACSYSSCSPGWHKSQTNCSTAQVGQGYRSCCPDDQSGESCNNDSDCPNGYYCDNLGPNHKGNCKKTPAGGGGGTTNGVAVNVKCNCTADFGACGDKFGKTNIQWRQCTPKVNGAQTCNWRVGVTFYQYKACSVTPTVTPVVSGTPTPTENPNCKCSAQGTCTTECQFNKFTDVTTYANPIKCGLADIFQSVPTADQKTGWCQAEMRTKGDADGNGNASLKDYFYYVAAKFGAKIPPTVNPDFNGDDKIDEKDGEIIIKSIMGGSTEADE